jgi:hypothetical protein
VEISRALFLNLTCTHHHSPQHRSGHQRFQAPSWKRPARRTTSQEVWVGEGSWLWSPSKPFCKPSIVSDRSFWVYWDILGF